jgi:hypothetical protein
MEFNQDSALFRVDVVVDTESDIPSPQDNWSAGSMVLIADSKDIKVLNNQREWI